MRNYFILSFFVFLSFIVPTHSQHELSATQIVRRMLTKTKEITALSYTMKKQERIKNTMPSQVTEVKMTEHPFKLYLKQLSPQKGLEVLYVQGVNGNKAVVNTNGFPWVNVNLDPMGSTMRENQHHTIFESGYEHLMSILEHLTAKYHKELESMVVKSGPVEWDGHTCWVITLQNPHFKYEPYVVKQGENLLTIAKERKLSEHMILEKNNLTDYLHVPAGRTLLVPNDYSPKLELYVDQQRFIPLVMKVYDDKGLYEYYEYSDVVINPKFSEQEFTKDNPDYDF